MHSTLSCRAQGKLSVILPARNIRVYMLNGKYQVIRQQRISCSAVAIDPEGIHEDRTASTNITPYMLLNR